MIRSGTCRWRGRPDGVPSVLKASSSWRGSCSGRGCYYKTCREPQRLTSLYDHFLSGSRWTRALLRCCRACRGPSPLSWSEQWTPLVLARVSGMDRIREFLNLYNQLDQHMRRILGADAQRSHASLLEQMAQTDVVFQEQHSRLQAY